MVEDYRIPRLRGMVPGGSFANDEDFAHALAHQVVQRAINLKALPKDYSPDHDFIESFKKAPVEILLTEEFLTALIQKILPTKSFGMARALAVGFGTVKLVADEKDIEDIIIVDGQDLELVGQDEKPLLDLHGQPLSPKEDSDEDFNRDRIARGGIGTLVYFSKLEFMREPGDLTDPKFVPTKAGIGICKRYPWVVSGISQDGYWVNAFESFGGRGWGGVGADRKHEYAAVASEGNSYPEAAFAAAGPGKKPRVFFVRGCSFKENSLLNLEPHKVK